MGAIIITVGGLSILFGALELLGLELLGKEDSWKGIAFKIGGGLVVVVIGALFAIAGI